MYGNCQAGSIAAVLAKNRALSRTYRTVYLRSYEHPSEGWQTLPPGTVEACAIVFEQHDPRSFPYGDQLAEGARVIKFPAMDFNLLWPFTIVNPYNPATRALPYGRFPYGDRTIVACIDRGMKCEEILDYYLTGWDDYKLDLDHLLLLETARLQARDAHCGVKMGTYAIEHFRGERLFWTVNHPTSRALHVLIERLLCAAFQEGEPERAGDIRPAFSADVSRDPLGEINVPVHPKIAAHFGLEWYDPNERHAAFAGHAFSYMEYFKTMIEIAIDTKRRGDNLRMP